MEIAANASAIFFIGALCSIKDFKTCSQYTGGSQHLLCPVCNRAGQSRRSGLCRRRLFVPRPRRHAGYAGPSTLQMKKPRPMPGLLLVGTTSLVDQYVSNSTCRLVPGDDRAAEAVVEAGGDHVDILMDGFAARERARNDRRGQDEVAVTHEEVIVFDRNRPVRGKAVFEADTDSAAPACFGRAIEHETGVGGHAGVVVAGRRDATLHVAEDVVPGVANLAGDHAEGIDLRAVGDVAEGEAEVGTGEVGPVALAFKTEHPVAGLPAIADLTADGAAACGVAAFMESRSNHGANVVVDVPALVGPAAAAVHADVEARPVVGREDRCRRLAVIGTGPEVGGGSSAGEQHRHSDSCKSDFLHGCEFPCYAKLQTRTWMLTYSECADLSVAPAQQWPVIDGWNVV